MSTSDFDQRSRIFFDWFKALDGATFSDSIKLADLRDRDAGRGIVAAEDIAPETILFTIPRKAILNVETSDLPRKLPAVFNAENVDSTDGVEELGLDSWSALILILIYEFLQGERSFWYPYFMVLPSTFETPMFWTDDDIETLQGSVMRDRIGKDDAESMFRANVLCHIRENSDLFPSSANMDDSELILLAHRMGSTVMAYAFDLENEEEEEDEEDGWVEDKEGKSMMGMVPMADILNADAEFNAHVNHGEDNLTVTALRHIKAGEEILNYYGPLPNSELLRRYGYVTSKHSRYDVVEVSWTILESAVAQQLGIGKDVLDKARSLMDLEELDDVFIIENETEEPSPQGTFTGQAELTEIPRNLQEQLKLFLKAVGQLQPGTLSDKRKRDEIQSLVIASALRAINRRYPTTVADDESLLARADLPKRARMAIQVRLGEKKLLRTAQNLLSGVGTIETLSDDDQVPRKIRRLGHPSS